MTDKENLQSVNKNIINDLNGFCLKLGTGQFEWFTEKKVLYGAFCFAVRYIVVCECLS